MGSPHHDLAQVRAGAPSAFIEHKPARLRTAERLGMTHAEADDYIRETIANLEPGNFHRTVIMEGGGPICDEYGIVNDDGSWYVKVYLDADLTVCISHHAPKKPMTTIDGTTVNP